MVCNYLLILDEFVPQYIVRGGRASNTQVWIFTLYVLTHSEPLIPCAVGTCAITSQLRRGQQEALPARHKYDDFI